MAAEPVALRVNGWYRVKSSGQFCRVQRIPSRTDPAVSIPSADQNTRGFELALEWYTPSAGPPGWTRRVLIMEVKKALALLQPPLPADRPALAALKKVAAALPVSAASRDGEFTFRP